VPRSFTQTSNQRRIEDQTFLKDGEEAEIDHPSSRKITEETAIFETRDLPRPLRCWIGRNSQPVLCNFGEARTRYGERFTFSRLSIEHQRCSCTSRGAHPWISGILAAWSGTSCSVDTSPGKVRQMNRPQQEPARSDSCFVWTSPHSSWPTRVHVPLNLLMRVIM